MTNEFFQNLSMWQQGGVSRTVTVYLGQISNPNDEYALLYDGKLGLGGSVNSLEELENLDLKQQALDRAKKELERLM